ECLGWMKGCEPKNNKCCSSYVCTYKYPWCRYDL
uniref:Mu-theraphotoxin-Osp1b n=1 Tax=Orphnaecus sp. (strain Maanghit-Cave/Philippines) TaxID=2024661 RepID=OSP1B_ORPS1|nr:RecName: Full=Mu-theraphotoxin-Osp1b; Short=Mu-TRTX-Osp1b [Orphnaecus sp. Maanghit-Cave]